MSGLVSRRDRKMEGQRGRREERDTPCMSVEMESYLAKGERKKGTRDCGLGCWERRKTHEWVALYIVFRVSVE